MLSEKVEAKTNTHFVYSKPFYHILKSHSRKQHNYYFIVLFFMYNSGRAFKLDDFNLFVTLQEFKRETRFTSTCSANELIRKIEEAAKPLGYDIQKKKYKVAS